MSRTNIPMFLDTPPDAERPQQRIDLAGQQGWQAAYDEVCDACEDQFLAGIDAEHLNRMRALHTVREELSQIAENLV